MKNIVIDFEDHPSEFRVNRGIHSRSYALYQAVINMQLNVWGCFGSNFTKKEVRHFRVYLGQSKENRARIYQDYMKENNYSAKIHCERNGDFYKVWVKKSAKT